MDFFKRILGNEWSIKPAGGLTGNAYLAEHNNRRLFLKRNSSPFLAVLSAEGIVPKLIWTKRMESGDVITAQEWLEGRPLEKEEMRDVQVVELLKKIHQSDELLQMLKRLGKTPVTAKTFYDLVQNDLREQNLQMKYPIVLQTVRLLEQLMPHITYEKYTVCHGDLHHNNLIRSLDGVIYLIDWDNTMIADPAFDLATAIDQYIPPEEWQEWLQTYGLKIEKGLIERMYYYLLLNSLHYVSWHIKRNEPEQERVQIKRLTELYRRAEEILKLSIL